MFRNKNKLNEGKKRKLIENKTIKNYDIIVYVENIKKTTYKLFKWKLLLVVNL